MSHEHTVLGIDYGLQRVGLALGNTVAGIASPLTTLANDDKLLGEIEGICHVHDVTQLVVGLPRGLDGQETLQTEHSRKFATQLESLELPVQLRDEAGTSSVAKERLGANPPAGSIDAEAAAIILQEYLDENRHEA